MGYYPVLLQLRGRACAVIGGDAVIEDKVRKLLEAEATVTVVDSAPTEGILDLARRGRIEHVRRAYRPGDLAGAFVAISARHAQPVIEQISAEARWRNIALNVIDEPDHCSFIAPSVARRGDLTIAVSTAGNAPALAVRLRQRIESEIGEHHAEFLRLAGRLRRPLAAAEPDFDVRRKLWYRIVDSEVLPLLRAGRRADAVATIADIVGFVPDVAP